MLNKNKKVSLFKIIVFIVLTSLLLSGCTQQTDKKSSDQSSTFLNIPPVPETPDIPKGAPNGWEMESTEIFFNDFESSPSLGLILREECTELVDDSIGGHTAVKLSNGGTIQTNADELPLSPDTYYVFEFDYKILNRGNDENNIVSTFLYPKESSNIENVIHCLPMLSNAEQKGTFSSGALTTSTFDEYYLVIQVHEDAEIIVDNIKIIRLTSMPITDSSERWSNLENISYPRLGNYMLGGTGSGWARSERSVPNWSDQYVYKEEEIEEALAFFDIVAGPHLNIQSKDTGFAKRMKDENSNIIMMPYANYIVTNYVWPPPHATIDPDEEFYLDMPNEWIMKHTNDSNVEAYQWPGQFLTNIYNSCPEVGGQTFDEAITEFMLDDITASGYWDGIFIDNVFGSTSHYVPNFMNPSQFDYDVNLNGQRDETIAQVNELSRRAVTSFLQNIKSEVGNNELIIVNNGYNLDYTVVSYVNGIVFELFTNPWFQSQSQNNELAWRRWINDYFEAQEKTLSPHLNILEAGGGGSEVGYGLADKNYLEPTANDIEHHRFALGSALLSDGFYEYDLYDAGSFPYWFDEYSVNNDGVAVNEPKYKGYLGMPLRDAEELKSSSTLIWEESFDEGDIPSSMEGDSEVSVNDNKLIINNPDHETYKPYGIEVRTKFGEIPFESGKTYVVEFEWQVLETLDHAVEIKVRNNEGNLASTRLHGVFKGDSNQERFHITIPDNQDYGLEFNLLVGGGKVSIDNIKIYEGGAGPWRRDFENGFVLVNPINKEYTFNAEELAGNLDRTGIKRILGTQAPDVNNGESVTDSVTLQPFDAIILLADHIPKS